jgi:hypothetical protein
MKYMFIYLFIISFLYDFFKFIIILFNSLTSKLSIHYFFLLKLDFRIMISSYLRNNTSNIKKNIKRNALIRVRSFD